MLTWRSEGSTSPRCRPSQRALTPSATTCPCYVRAHFAKRRCRKRDCRQMPKRRWSCPEDLRGKLGSCRGAPQALRPACQRGPASTQRCPVLGVAELQKAERCPEGRGPCKPNCSLHRYSQNFVAALHL